MESREARPTSRSSTLLPRSEAHTHTHVHRPGHAHMLRRAHTHAYTCAQRPPPHTQSHMHTHADPPPHTHTHTCVHASSHHHTRTLVQHTHAQACTDTRMHRGVPSRSHACACLSTQVRPRTRICTYLSRAHTHTCENVCMLTSASTHKSIPGWCSALTHQPVLPTLTNGVASTLASTKAQAWLPRPHPAPRTLAHADACARTRLLRGHCLDPGMSSLPRTHTHTLHAPRFPILKEQAVLCPAAFRQSEQRHGGCQSGVPEPLPASGGTRDGGEEQGEAGWVWGEEARTG